MQITVFPSGAELDAFAAEQFISLVESNPIAVLGLATGSTPIKIYEKIAEMHRNRSVSFRGVTTFNLDEYVGLSPTHEQSYAYYMYIHLFRRLDIPMNQTHLPDAMAEDLEIACTRYDRMLAGHPIDLQLLGLGHNGHIGFNEPGTTMAHGTHVVALKAETRAANARFFRSPEEVPTKAVTMGTGAILKARRIVLVVRGADKADILYQALTGPITTACPASFLQTHANVMVLTDKDAGRKLSHVIQNGQLVHH